MSYKLIHGDCLIESDKIKSGSVDLILTDLPYGTMKGAEKSDIYGSKDKPTHEWDSVIDTDKIMQLANRILRKNGKMILFAQDPFSTELKTKAIPNLPYNYSLIWEKDTFAFALIAKKAPVNYYEDILVFSKSSEAVSLDVTWGRHPLKDYSSQLIEFIGLPKSEIYKKVNLGSFRFLRGCDKGNFTKPTHKVYQKLIELFGINNMNDFMTYEEINKIDKTFKMSKKNERLDYLQKHNQKYPSTFNLWEGQKYKSNILKYKKDYTGFHPTQKPVLLLEDLIKTFSNENDLVVDLTMGSGSTGVACMNTNRKFIGIEKEKKYVDIATQRIQRVLTVWGNEI